MGLGSNMADTAHVRERRGERGSGSGGGKSVSKGEGRSKGV